MSDDMPREMYIAPNVDQDWLFNAYKCNLPEHMNATRYVRADKSITIEELEAMKRNVMYHSDAHWNAALDAVIERLR